MNELLQESAKSPDAGPAPSVGEKITATILDIAFGGEGVARVHDFVIFVPFVLLGEEVEIELTEVKKRFGRGRLLRVLKASPHRVEPQCRYFEACGGCQYQHIDYPAQLSLKHKQITDLFERIGGIDGALIDPVVPCPAPYGYRNRIMIRSQWNKPAQKLNIGFLRYDNRLVEDIVECKIAEPELNEEIRKVRQNPPPKGGIKVVLRLAPEGWEVPHDSFFQNNFHLLPGLIETVRERLRSARSKFLIDAYCGVGFFGIEVADLVTGVVGVELDLLAIKAARRNAQARGRANVEFVPGRTEELLPSLVNRFPAAETTLLIDPPRTGCPPESLELLRQVKPAQILYVSCHPATLARDLNLLCADQVYQVSRVTPLDMFPQTQHVECVADLRRVPPPSSL
jgi:tRNA/tmRNA/rRNA uracil-C5-methylase (TrmA/RlmC/RlmD family)